MQIAQIARGTAVEQHIRVQRLLSDIYSVLFVGVNLEAIASGYLLVKTYRPYDSISCQPHSVIRGLSSYTARTCVRSSNTIQIKDLVSL